jgi:hypothetical protein
MRALFATHTNPTAKQWQANVSHMSKKEKVDLRLSRNRFVRITTQEIAVRQARRRTIAPKYRPTQSTNHSVTEISRGLATRLTRKDSPHWFQQLRSTTLG